ncbi:hypothetical protein DPMN_158506 [Dreissena polymorpha]|uniref:DUF7869 domain-containing protein n=1 Tax=Dreissena polymorpha TaxID=45954 RepID=A0A9D4EHY9_DREPO|nr:hypothetical protein DPMN_158506 [Dreissena polymorpha]
MTRLINGRIHLRKCYGAGEAHALLHADNRSGQNKNIVVLWNLMWTIAKGLHHKIEFSMMIAGHTKFASDQHFDIWKNKLRHMDAEILQDVANSVEKSSRNRHTHPHIVDEDFDFHGWRLCLSKFFVPLKGLLSELHNVVQVTGNKRLYLPIA